MCAMSMVGDFYTDKFKPISSPVLGWPTWSPNQAEWEQLKKDVQDMKELLLRAKKYDEDNNEPHCEMEEKVALLKKVAEFVGVDLKEVFG